MSERDDLSALGAVGIIGAGAAGTVLGRAVAARGARVTAVAARHLERALRLVGALPGAEAVMPAEVVGRCELVFLAVSDDAIGALAEELPWRAGQRVVHLSGARGAELLAAAQAKGAAVAALHPLMTFSRADLTTPAEAVLGRLRGCAWALEASDPALADELAGLVAALGGWVLALRPENRVPYHMAAVFASNYVVALLGAAVRLWASFGVEGEAALRALLPLTRAAVEKLEADGLPDALSGPIARGDAGTLAAHLEWLDAHVGGSAEGATLREAYRALGLLAIPLAEAKGSLSAEAAARLRALLE